MRTKIENKRVRVEKHRQRQRTRAERRRTDRALVALGVAQRLGIQVAILAQAMRSAGVTTAITETQARQWVDDPENAPEWLMQLRGERLAQAAEAGYRRAKEAERQQLRELAAEQSALTKVNAGKRRFSADEWIYVQGWAFRAAKDLVRGWCEIEIDEFNRQVPGVVGIDADNHHTWPVHAGGGCDGVGEQHCVVRLEQMRAERRADALIDSVAKKTALRDLDLTPGQFVSIWHGVRVGLVVKVNKVSVKIRMVGGRADRNVVIEKNLDLRYIELAASTLPTPPNPGAEVVLRDHGGHTRRARVVEVDGPLFEATYSLKSGQWGSGWFDLAAIQPPEVSSL